MHIFEPWWAFLGQAVGQPGAVGPCPGFALTHSQGRHRATFSVGCTLPCTWDADYHSVCELWTSPRRDAGLCLAGTRNLGSPSSPAHRLALPRIGIGTLWVRQPSRASGPDTPMPGWDEARRPDCQGRLDTPGAGAHEGTEDGPPSSGGCTGVTCWSGI